MAKSIISLISPPTRANSRTVPADLICLSAWLEKHDLPNNIIDIKVKWDPFTHMGHEKIEEISYRIVEEINKFEPPFVGISCYTTEYPAVMRLADLIRKHCQTSIIIGGLHATIQPEDFFFDNSPVDFAVIGEGEISLEELIKNRLSHESPGDVKGIAFRDNGSLIKTPERERIKDLSVIPRPAYEKIDMEYYLKPSRYSIRLLLLSGLHIFTTRGCPYSCTFCANRKKKVTYRPIPDVIEEINWLKKQYDIDSFYIADDTFCLKKDRVYEFVNELSQLPFKIIWGMETTVNTISFEMIDLLKKGGCIQIDLGVESGSQKILDRMKKKITIEQIETAFRICGEAGIRTYATVMLNNPDETEEDIDETIKLMKKIKATNYGININTPFLGTEDYQRFVHPELTKEEYVLYNHPDLFHTIVDKRFRLAKHNLNLDKLYIRILVRFSLIKKTIDLTTNIKYYLILLKSKRKKEYITAFKESVLRQARIYYSYFRKLIHR